MSQILTELDGLEPMNDVVVIAATNRPDIIDPALLRPGRFDKAILVGPPDEASRKSILEIKLRDKPLADDVDADAIAKETEGCTGADLSAICNEAVMSAVRKLVSKGQMPTDEEIAGCRVSMEDFRGAISKFGPSAKKELESFDMGPYGKQ